MAVVGDKGQVQGGRAGEEEGQEGQELFNTHPDTQNMEYSAKEAEPAW